MFSEQCKRKAERAQKLQRAWNWQLVVPPVLLTAVWDCLLPEPSAFCQSAVFVCHSVPALASAVPVNNQEMFHKLLRTVSTLDLLNVSSGFICPRRLRQFRAA